MTDQRYNGCTTQPPKHYSSTKCQLPPVDKEELMVEKFRRLLREAKANSAVGEATVRLVFQDGGVRKTSIGMKIEYEFVAD